MSKFLKLFSLVILLCLLLTFFISCGTDVAGKYSLRWIDTNQGTMYDTPDLCIELKSDRTFIYGTSKGTWSIKGDTITLTYDTGKTTTLSYSDEYLTQEFPYTYPIGSYKYTFGKDE